MCHALGTTVLTLLVMLTLLVSMGRGDGVSPLRAAAGSYEQDLMRWEVTHFMDKWLTRAGDLLLFRSPGEEERHEAIDEFFALGDDLRAARDALEAAVAAPPAMREATPEEAQREVDGIQRRRTELQPVVEEALEAAISSVVRRLGIIDGIGPLRLPPVDFTFEERSLVLVHSPRDRIDRLDDLLLDPDVSLLDQEDLEAAVEGVDDNTSALVIRIGGVATYPAQVSPNRSLHGTLELASHEWLHHWLAFRPLGRGWFGGGEIQSINETAANIFGEEIGDRALELLTGEAFDRTPWQPPTIEPFEEPAEDVFDFRREMRRTRIALEELLGDSQIEEAETFLEERRLEFVANGSNIRRLNNAWFAFNGTYADSPASISPIEGQLRTIRADSAGLAEWLDRIAGITEPGELERLALEAGWAPIDPRTGLPQT
jgi:hypothetical protein